jgi:SAM-dependent methyltransferase
MLNYLLGIARSWRPSLPLIKDLLKHGLSQGAKTSLRKEFGSLMHAMLPCYQGFLPYRAMQSYLLPKTPDKAECYPGSPLPVPPRALWLGYGETVEAYLANGMHNVQTMECLLQASGMSFESSKRILELGCAAGRMIRWLHPLTEACEIWGTDIDATAITWCQQHLSPPFHFATTTIFPHLPFEDQYFGLVYAGSVFTHIDDLADAWFLELRRVLRRGGRLYITLHDRRTVDIVSNEQDDRSWIVEFRNYVRSFPEYDEFSHSDFGMFSLRQCDNAQVFYDIEFLSRKLKPFFHVLSVTEEAYGKQSAMTLERI